MADIDSLDDDMVKLVAYSIVTLERGKECFVEGGEVMVTDRMSHETFTTWMIARYLQSLKETPAILRGVQDQINALSARVARDEALFAQQLAALQADVRKLAGWARHVTTALNQQREPVGFEAFSAQLQQLNTWITESIESLSGHFVQPAGAGPVQKQLTQLRIAVSTLFQKRLNALREWVEHTRRVLSGSAARHPVPVPDPQIGQLAPPAISIEPQLHVADYPAQPATPVSTRNDLKYLRVYFVVSKRWPREPLRFHENQIRTLQDIHKLLH